MTRTNEYGQPIGPPMHDWAPPRYPPGEPLQGRYTRLESLDPERHAPALFAALEIAPGSLWTYMSFGPFAGPPDLEKTLEELVGYPDWVPYAIFAGEEPRGFASYLRINPHDGVIEVGSIVFAPELQRTTAATEAIYLMLGHVFDLGYRRCEWKCDDLNEPSRRAALRLGFVYEGTFRNATHYKQRSRDTAWYAMTDSEWPAIEAGFESWLADENFDELGRQRRSLRQIREGRT